MSSVRNYDIFKGEDLAIADKILQRRLQMLIHSCLYYHLNFNIISDKKYDEWAKELKKLQDDNPDISKKVWWAKDFEGYDPSSGFYLPYTDPWVVEKAVQLMRRHG